MKYLLIIISLTLCNYTYSVEYSEIEQYHLLSLYNVDSDYSEDDEILDPWEKMNRKLYEVHKFIDGMFLYPLSTGYSYIVPKFIRQRIYLFLQNLSEPVTAVNFFLQGEGERALLSVWRVIFNSTLGLGGMIDFANNYLSLPYHKSDFGQTLHSWNVGKGNYLFIPVLGPFSYRDAVGNGVDGLMNPTSYVFNRGLSISLFTISGFEKRQKFNNMLNEIEKNSLDPYATIRSLYWQSRKYFIINCGY